MANFIIFQHYTNKGCCSKCMTVNGVKSVYNQITSSKNAIRKILGEDIIVRRNYDPARFQGIGEIFGRNKKLFRTANIKNNEIQEQILNQKLEKTITYSLGKLDKSDIESIISSKDAISVLLVCSNSSNAPALIKPSSISSLSI